MRGAEHIATLVALREKLVEVCAEPYPDTDAGKQLQFRKIYDLELAWVRLHNQLSYEALDLYEEMRAARRGSLQQE